MVRGAVAGSGRFQIKRELGAGGMGTVYEAFDREKHVTVALKTLRRADATSLRRFKREFRALEGLEHPNVVSLGELLESEGEWFFTMELIAGCDFLSYVRGEAAPHFLEPAHEARLRSSLRQVARGLVALHGRGLVHRDIKPTNILVTPQGRAVLMDFGLVTEMGASRLSTAAHVVGTATYMAPEQASGDKVSAMADWYSVGVLLYEALTGRLPFDGSSMHVLMDKLQYEATPPRAHVPGVAPDLDELCVELLRREPGNRPPASVILKRLGLDDPAIATTQSASGSYSSQATPFVGRDTELALLGEAFDASRTAPVVVLVEGESGMGKSALVEQFSERKTGSDHDVMVLTGRCYEREQVPYKAFDGVADSLCQRLVGMRSEEVARAMPLYIGLLPLLFPVLKRVEAIARAPVVPALPDAQAQRTRMFGAFREMLVRISKRHRLIILLDDLQWTCADSLTLFEEVFGHEEAPPALLLATLRPVVEDTRRAMNKAMEMVQDVRRISVDSLPEEQAHALASLLMPKRTASDIRALVRETGGHPLFVHELARHSLSGELGMSLDAALQARMAALSAPALALLTVLCVAGRPITQEVAALSARLDGGTFTKAASVLRVAYLARTDGSRTRDTIGPYHDRVREALVATLDDAQRVAAHDRLATALEQTGGDARAIVRHAIAAGQSVRAAANAVVAAETAYATMAFDQAAEFYETALTLGNHGPQPLLRLLLARAETLKSAGRCREAAEGFMLAADAAEAAKAEPAVGVHCRIQAVEQWLISGHLDKGFEASTELLADIGERTAKTPARAVATLLWNRARLRLGQQAYPVRQDTEIDRDTLNRLDVLRAMAMGLTFTDLVRCADFSARFLIQARRAGEPVRLVQGLGVEACFLAAQGGRAGKAARALLEQMAAIVASRPDDAYLAGYLPGIEGIVSMNEGRFVSAAKLMEHAERVFVSLRSRNMLERNAVQMYRMVALRLAGMTAACRSATTTFLRDAHRRGDTYFATTLCTYRTQDLLASDQPSQAAAYLDGASFTPVEKGYHLQDYFALDARGELALYDRNACSALTALRQSIEGLTRSLLLRNQLLRVVYRWLHARLLVSAVASDPTRNADLRAAGTVARQLAGEELGCATVYSLLTRAAQSTLATRPDNATVVGLLRQSIVLAEELDMASCAAAARYRLGNMLGGHEGAELRAEAEAWCAREGVVRPESYFEVLAPGFMACWSGARAR